MHPRPRRVLATSLVAISALTVAACSEPEGGFDAGDEGENQITLVEQPWEDLMVENAILSQVLEELGYSVTIEELSVPLGAEALSSGDADAYLGNWWPSQEEVFAQYIDTGGVEILGTLVTGATYEPAVPRYAAEQLDVTSLADLAPNAEEFDNEFLGIEAGTPGNQSIQDAIDDDTYDLGDWDLLESSTPAMLAEVEQKVDSEQPVVFLAWEPHWMNVEWDLVYLDDPEEAWPGAGEIRVATRENFETDNPNVARLLSQMEVDTDTASDWVYDVSQEGMSAEDVASAWIADNSDEIGTWLDGVETVDGEPAEAPHD